MPTRPASHARQARAAARDAPRPTAAQRGYGGRWQRARLVHLREHPLCERCHAAGLTTAASVVDHVVPHRGDPGLFWDRGNWQSLCEPCHGTKTATEDGGFGRPARCTAGAGANERPAQPPVSAYDTTTYRSTGLPERQGQG